MTGSTVNGSGNGMRSGAQTLTLLAAPLNVAIMRSLADGSKRQAQLRHLTGIPAETTLRAQLKRLVGTGAIEKHRRNRFPGVLEYELSEAGRELLGVADVLSGWLEQSPEGLLELGSSAARAAVKALTEGWSTTMLRALAARALTLTELDGIVHSLSYPSVERRLAAMRLAGLVKASDTDRRGTPNAMTEWGHRGVAPLVAAARWECRYAVAKTAPVGSIDVEAAFLLASGLLSPLDEAAGTCRLAVELRDATEAPPVGILLTLRGGRAISCTTRMEGDADACALGSLVAWFAAAIDGDLAGLELTGDAPLARAIVGNLRHAHFAQPVRD